MEVKELKIGNFIYDNDGIVSKITGFTPFDHSTRCDEIEGCLVLIDIYRPNGEISKGWECDSNTIKPIELTEEWLMKFGFIKKDEGYGILTSMKQAVLISFGNHNCSINGLSFNNPTKYVHQLQNLFFALIGEELELK